MENYYSDLHTAYRDGMEAFERTCPYVTAAMLVSIDNYSRACALFIWNKMGVETEKCARAINSIYYKEDGKRIYSKEQVELAIKRLSSNDYKLPVPPFFFNIISSDIENNSDFSRRLASCFKLFDLSYALIDGDVNDDELKLISEMQEKLIEECDKSGVLSYENTINYEDYLGDVQIPDLLVSVGENDSVITLPTDHQQVKTASKESVENDTRKKSKRTIREVNSNPINELEGLIGLASVKEEVREIIDFTNVQKARIENGLPTSPMSYHLVFTGNPGTGKTTVARLIAQIYKDLGIVSDGHLVEVSAKDLIAGYIGQTAIKTGEVISDAIGGVLFIDEAYTLFDKTGQGYGQEAIDTLLKEMEDHREELAVIVAGYDDLMKEFIHSNPGLESRFNRFIHFDDYSAEELREIFLSLCEKNAYVLTEEASATVSEYFERVRSQNEDNFANGRMVRNLFESIIGKQASRIADYKKKTKELLSTIEKEDVDGCIDSPEKEETLEEAVAELNQLVGLAKVKEEISDLIYIVQNQQRRIEQGLSVPSLSLHLVFTGNPGTGKTTVARCISKIYRSLGLLSRGHLIETDRSGLVAGYVGQTAIKTKDVINDALGGVLFIDEAYTLSNGLDNDYGQEAIDTILKFMEDNRKDLVVIVAGYDDLMNGFIHSNPGLESRFNRYIHFDDYSSDEMFEIFEGLCEKNQYTLSNDASEMMKHYLDLVDASKIGNGRGVRNAFEKIVTQQAKRIETTSSENVEGISVITSDDIANAITG